MRDENTLRSLSGREREILYLLVEGLSNRDIAQKLSLTVRTVKFHTGNIYTRLGVSSRAEAIAWVWRQAQAQNPLAE